MTVRMEDPKILSNSLNIRTTDNKMGFMIQSTDEYCEALYDFLKQRPKPVRVADLGVAYGFTTKKLLEAGANVVANDLSPSHLDVLWNSVDKEAQERLTLLPGNVLEISLQQNYFDGILACRWMHFLTGDELRKVLGKCYEALKPGGKLCITTESIHHGIFKPVSEAYQQKKKDGVDFPGYWPLSELDTPIRDQPNMMMLYDTDVMQRELVQVGFRVLKIGYFDRRGVYPKNGCFDGREGLGVTAEK